MAAGLQVPVFASQTQLLDLIKIEHFDSIKVSDEIFVRAKRVVTEWESLNEYLRALWAVYQNEKTKYVEHLYINALQGNGTASSERQAAFDAASLQLKEGFARYLNLIPADVLKQNPQGFQDNVEEVFVWLMNRDTHELMMEAREHLRYYQLEKNAYLKTMEELLEKYKRGVINTKVLKSKVQLRMKQFNEFLKKYELELERKEAAIAWLVNTYKSTIQK